MLLLISLLSSINCAELELTVKGSSMEPLLVSSQVVTAVRSGCIEVSRDDFVVFKNSATAGFTIKRAVAIPGDSLSWEGSYLLINGSPALTPSGKNYSFTNRSKLFFKSYLDEPITWFLVLGRPGSLDSARIGPIPPSEIVAIIKSE